MSDFYKSPRQCRKCGRGRGKYAHICPSPEALRFEGAMARAADVAGKIRAYWRRRRG